MHPPREIEDTPHPAVIWPPTGPQSSPPPSPSSLPTFPHPSPSLRASPCPAPRPRHHSPRRLQFLHPPSSILHPLILINSSSSLLPIPINSHVIQSYRLLTIHPSQTSPRQSRVIAIGHFLPALLPSPPPLHGPTQQPPPPHPPTSLTIQHPAPSSSPPFFFTRFVAISLPPYTRPISFRSCLVRSPEPAPAHASQHY
ncbi:unnamed protein product [Cutaneotrichosporon oleaginosum]